MLCYYLKIVCVHVCPILGILAYLRVLKRDPREVSERGKAFFLSLFISNLHWRQRHTQPFLFHRGLKVRSLTIRRSSYDVIDI